MNHIFFEKFQADSKLYSQKNGDLTRSQILQFLDQKMFWTDINLRHTFLIWNLITSKVHYKLLFVLWLCIFIFYKSLNGVYFFQTKHSAMNWKLFLNFKEIFKNTGFVEAYSNILVNSYLSKILLSFPQ